MALVDDLKAARDLIADPARWTTGSFAKSAKGRDVDMHGRRAVCFCAQGAIYREADTPAKAIDALARACTALYKFDGFDRAIVAKTNDTLGHAAILEAFNLAIERASLTEQT